MRIFLRLLIFLILAVSSLYAQTPRVVNRSASQFRIARLKYAGGGDWYNDPTEEPNLLRFIKEHTNIEVNPEYTWVDIASDDIFNFPFLFLTGHGNVDFS